MNANALEMMIVPIVRGLFLVVMLGAGGIGLVRMLGAVASSAGLPPGWDVDGPAMEAGRRQARTRRGADADRRLGEDDLATAGA